MSERQTEVGGNSGVEPRAPFVPRLGIIHLIDIMDRSPITHAVAT